MIKWFKNKKGFGYVVFMPNNEVEVYYSNIVSSKDFKFNESEIEFE